MPLAILAPPRCSPSCCPKKPLGSLPELPAFAWLLGVVVVVVVFSLKMGIKAKGFYDCQSSCFSLLFIFNQTVYPSQMICNEFIGFNYCVKKGKKEREKRKNKPYKLEHGLYIHLGLTSVGTFRVHGILYCSQDRDRTWPPKTFPKDKKNNKKSRKLLFLCDLFPLQC